ncbi:MAG: glycine cleavage system protein GcvH [Clostridiales bacterium]|nr:glycine cleavage system protein GcvH [Clostridiales bacterium]
MNIKPGLKYSPEHEWARAEGSKVYVGVADYAQEHLGDIVFVDLPLVGDLLEKGDVLGVVESVKAASDVYSPVAGKIVAVNEELADNPALINLDPYGAWIAVVEAEDISQLNGLLDETAYAALCGEGD